MTIKLPVSQRKTELLGLAFVKALKLKPDKDGLYKYCGSTMSLAGLGCSIIKTIEDMLQYSESELEKMIKDGY